MYFLVVIPAATSVTSICGNLEKVWRSWSLNDPTKEILNQLSWSKSKNVKQVDLAMNVAMSADWRREQLASYHFDQYDDLKPEIQQNMTEVFSSSGVKSLLPYFILFIFHKFVGLTLSQNVTFSSS